MMKTMELNVDDLRRELMRTISDTDDVEVLTKVRNLLQCAKDKCKDYVLRTSADEVVCEDEVEYITKQEILDGIREGLIEMYRAKRTGEKLKTAEELLDEL